MRGFSASPMNALLSKSTFALTSSVQGRCDKLLLRITSRSYVILTQLNTARVHPVKMGIYDQNGNQMVPGCLPFTTGSRQNFIFTIHLNVASKKDRHDARETRASGRRRRVEITEKNHRERSELRLIVLECSVPDLVAGNGKRSKKVFCAERLHCDIFGE